MRVRAGEEAQAKGPRASERDGGLKPACSLLMFPSSSFVHELCMASPTCHACVETTPARARPPMKGGPAGRGPRRYFPAQGPPGCPGSSHPQARRKRAARCAALARVRLAALVEREAGPIQSAAALAARLTAGRIVFLGSSHEEGANR